MVFKTILDAWDEFYIDPLAIFFGQEKEPENYFSYTGFRIRGFRGLEDVSLDFSKNDLLLLLGLNESGKTSILKAIEAFDFNNDPDPDGLKRFFTSMRNKQDVESSTPCIITADIHFTEELEFGTFKKYLGAAGYGTHVKGEVEGFLKKLSDRRTVRISRVIPFTNGSPGKSYYQFEGADPLGDPRVSRILAQAIVARCPFIMYFEDFQDSIPDKVYTSKRSDAYNHTWYEIIDGLFYNTDAKYNIKKFESYYAGPTPRVDDALSVLKRVNKKLRETFTEKWQNLSGVKEIDDAEITYNSAKKYFEIKIFESDGTTYSVHERSKGAVWYLAFLMKTEFRRKKLREGSGKPVYLIDEPASNLHSTAQQKMIGDFITLVEDTTLIYTTHSRYLISPANVKNTYVVVRDKGVVRCIRWGDYIKGKNAQTSYYQPLQDCLEIVPTNFDIPWEKAIITEGPSDALALEIMQTVLAAPRTHAIYPGSSAHALGTLISLNVGWKTQFRVLLDSDKDGRKAADRYQKDYGLTEDSFVFLPGKDTKIEDMFTKKEKDALSNFALAEPNPDVSKKEFLAVLRSISAMPDAAQKKVSDLLSAKTKSAFRTLFNALKA